MRRLPRPQPDAPEPRLTDPSEGAWVAGMLDVGGGLREYLPVAGSADLVRAICTHSGLEAVALRPDTDLTVFADTVNHLDPAA